MTAKEVLKALVSPCPACAKARELRSQLLNELYHSECVDWGNGVRVLPDLECGLCSGTGLTLTVVGVELADALRPLLSVEPKPEVPL